MVVIPSTELHLHSILQKKKNLQQQVCAPRLLKECDANSSSSSNRHPLTSTARAAMIPSTTNHPPPETGASFTPHHSPPLFSAATRGPCKLCIDLEIRSLPPTRAPWSVVAVVPIAMERKNRTCHVWPTWSWVRVIIWKGGADLAVDVGACRGCVGWCEPEYGRDPERTDQIVWELISWLAVYSQRMGPRDLDS